MRTSVSWPGLAAVAASLSAVVHSFPTAENFAKILQRDSITPEEVHESLLRVKQKRLLFDPLTTPISVTGEHEFKAPDFDAGEQRGPCPGLNALANHGYLARDGVVTFAGIIETVNTVMGMGIELITVLAVMGTVFVGDPVSLNPGFSIGGVTSDTSNILDNLGGLLGTPRGLSGSHNWIEGDSSNTRDDLYVTGDASTMNMTLFLEAYNAVEGDVITMADIGDRAASRFEDSIGINPYFYYGPYTGLVARNAGYIFTGRLLSNHTTEYPRGGQLSKDVFKSFFAVTEASNGSLVYTRGHERIPENWYRIAVDFGLTDVNVDLVAWLTAHPELASVGGNLGAVDTFAGLDLADVTGGVLNATSLLEGNNLLCFALEVVRTFAPDATASLFKTLAAPLKLVNDAVLDPLLDLGCPEFGDLTMGGTDLLTGLLDKYPGANKSGSAF